MQGSCTFHLKGSKRHIDTLTKKLSGKAWLISTVLNIVIWIELTRKVKGKEYTVVLSKIQFDGLQFNTVFRLVTRLKHGSSWRGEIVVSEGSCYYSGVDSIWLPKQEEGCNRKLSCKQARPSVTKHNRESSYLLRNRSGQSHASYMPRGQNQ